jgi:uracil-DNA glycosylase family protein
VSAAAYLPDRRTLASLREAVDGCRGCGLWEHATQGVLSEGSQKADLVLVGEQPGDQEDRQGKPFVGPAGRVLDRALEEAGVDRSRAYVTNAVKHFKWTPRGKRRIHEKPTWQELTACRPWLEAELDVVKPSVLVCLGASAAQSVLGRQFRVTRKRGIPFPSELAERVVATIHPSAVLRAQDDEARELEFQGLVRDLRVVAELLTASRSAA